jgi:hypothetical protein
MSTGSLARSWVRSRQQGFILALLVLFIGLAIQYRIKTAGGHAERSAFGRWRGQIFDLWDGKDVYVLHNYPNAPIMALILTPLALLPDAVGSLGWFVLKVAMALLSVYWVCRLVETRERPFPAWAKALTILLSLRPIMGDLSHGNVNLFILFLVVGSLHAFHRRHDLAAGLLLALAITCKVTPALFLPYFAWKRSWITLGGCAVGLVLFFVVVPGCVLGMRNNAALLGSWYQVMIKPFVVDGVVTTEHINQSIPGLVYRLGTHSPSSLKYVENLPVPVEYHNLLDLTCDQARWLVKGFMALFAGLVVWTCRTPTLRRHGWRLPAEFSLIVLGMLLFSERTWKHHCVTLLLPFAVIAYYLAACRPAAAMRAYLVSTLVAVVLLMASTSTSLLPQAKLGQVYGAYTWACLLLVAAMAALLRAGAKCTSVSSLSRERAAPPNSALVVQPVPP